LVTPQNWLFLASYKKLRQTLLARHLFAFAVRLGEHGFDSPAAAGAFVGLFCLLKSLPTPSTSFVGYEAADEGSTTEKAHVLQRKVVSLLNQAQQQKNPECRIVLAVGYDSISERLSKFVSVAQGSSTGDDDKFTRCFWEVRNYLRWRWFLAAADSDPFSGRSTVWDWPDDSCELSSFAGARVQGLQAVGKAGFAIAGSRRICCGIYLGEYYNKALASVVPINPDHSEALWAFFTSGEFEVEVRRLDQKLLVTPGTFGGVPFRLDHWQKIAEEKYSYGLPKPYSNDPTQWLFHGHPAQSDEPLQVAVARLLGYRWPVELDSAMELSDEARDWLRKVEAVLSFADEDGIVCISPVRGEAAAADRLLNLLAAAYGENWNTDKLSELLKQSDHADKTLDSWLRDKFFVQHCKLFHHRPFIWHIWDGLNDGFAALVNYHKLDRKNLETLIYTYLGDWIKRQKDDISSGVDGAYERLAAAENLKKQLELILKGEEPYDIFVRWKPLKKQPIGWDPDLNDGVRLNIRPFMSVADEKKKGAGILRDKPNIHWKKDRGKDVTSAPWYHLGPEYGGKEGDRINDHHRSLAEKRVARMSVEEGNK